MNLSVFCRSGVFNVSVSGFNVSCASLNSSVFALAKYCQESFSVSAIETDPWNFFSLFSTDILLLLENDTELLWHSYNAKVKVNVDLYSASS